jgi:Na+-transporting NADH:ubiquinone oxidoreductase subunit NqrB
LDKRRCRYSLFSINIYFRFIDDFLTIELCNPIDGFILYTNSTVMFSTQLFKDARYFQIIFQSIFLCYGVFILHWHNENWLYLTYFVTSLVMQFICEYFLGKKGIPLLQRLKYGIPSVLISSFGLSLLLKTNYWWVAVLAASVSILSKYILRLNGKHIFNPSAFGIVVAVLLTGNAWISPGQWGSGAVIMFGVLSLGFIVTTRVQKLDVSIAFLGTFAGLVFIRQIIYLGWPIDHFIQSVSTGSLLLFSFFMITDPKTIPNHTLARIFWCIAIAAVAFYLTAFKFMNGAPIFVLVLAQPLVPILDKLFKAKKFEWAAPSISPERGGNLVELIEDRFAYLIQLKK